MTETDGIEHITGVALITGDGRIHSSAGIAADPRVRALLGDRAWLDEACEKRMAPIILRDVKLIAFVKRTGDAVLVILSVTAADTVMNFLLNVDFAYDIVAHVLTDPYDAMAVVDRDAKIAFISPVHEKFFGLRAGEAIGKPVRDVIENTRLHHVVRTGIAEVGQIHRMKGSDRVVSRHPVKREGRIVGAIGRVMFKGPEQVDALARKVNALEKEIATYRAASAKTRLGEEHLDAIIGQSVAIQSVREQIRKIAPLDIPVLIRGESGTGKELVAQALHMLSPRQDGRLITVNAAALPESLVESELFGYEEGSFTGAARKGKAGKFELADKGTIFLDEIGDMPIEVQSKLLRVLQDRMVERIGGEKPKRVDFRLCSATNRDLEYFVEQGKFRLDLFYRISPVEIFLPPLRERIEDIPHLLAHFVSDLAERYHRATPEIHPDLHDYLTHRAWPGNVRQLRHEIERAFVFCEDGKLGADNFRTDATRPLGPTVHAAQSPLRMTAPSGTLKDSLEAVENTLIADALNRFKGNKKKAAAHLGVSRSYLYKKLEQIETGAGARGP